MSSSSAKSAALAFSVSKIGLDQEQVDAALDQARGLLAVGRAQLVEGDVARARVVDVRRDRRGLRRAARARRRRSAAGPACEYLSQAARASARRGDVHLAGDVRQAVVGLRDRGRAEGIGLDEVGAGGEVLLVDLGDDVRPRQRQQLVVALEVVRMVREALAAEVAPRRAGSAGSSCPSRRRGSGCVGASSSRRRFSTGLTRRLKGTGWDTDMGLPALQK